MDQLIEFASNNIILAGLWVALVVMLVYSFISGLTSPVKEVGTHELTQLVNKKDAIVLDVRPPKEYRSGHILGARQIKQEEVKNRDFKKLENQKDKPIIVVCGVGNNARTIGTAMAKAGFSDVRILKGGMNAWQSASLPLAK
ncbi:rhodanese-like domain-containing protein [Salinimonas chungwhensis]|uniref:rhodanese-like domain-containing protein n=1 Tax=Salinimonas chungwhensis TaxID=265425 RepID=UPI000377B09E|nr:rhodanese-like domain-containing protein [Salinimonas chungwhensis]